MRKRFLFGLAVFGMACFSSCEDLDNDPNDHINDFDPGHIGLNEMALVLSQLPISTDQIREVHDAVSSSSGNGYDEEYTMGNLLSAPGAGVGDLHSKSTRSYSVPLRDLLESRLRALSAEKTRAAAPENRPAALDRLGVEGFLKVLTESDIQIYWPFSDRWDGDGMPIITYDPEDGSEVNVGYRLSEDDDGSRIVEEVLVDESVAEENPVWVVNRNDDAEYLSLEMLRKTDPEWETGGGNIVIRPMALAGMPVKSGASESKSLLLRDFTMKRNYDSWFAGASEFFVKIGAVEDFTASTEAELRLYNPSVTDFMVVVRRNKVGTPQPFNVLLVSNWTDQMTHCAMMITEDDGGTRTSWDCSALVRVNSKSYGVEIKLPFNSRDDIVWRGQLGRDWFERNNKVTGHFGDVDLTFEILEN